MTKQLMTGPSGNNHGGKMNSRGETKLLGETKLSLLYLYVSYINDINITC